MKKLIVLSLSFALAATGSLPPAEEVALELAALETVSLLETLHVSGGVLDDDRSGAIFDGYFSALDPEKVYFRKADIDAFRAHREQLDDELRRGDLRFALAVGDRLRERVEIAAVLAREILATPFDLTRNEYQLAKRSDAEYAGSDVELREAWRKALKLRLLERTVVSGASARSDEAARAALWRELEATHESMRTATRSETLRTFIDVVAQSFDPHTRFLLPEERQDLEIELRLRLVGIGARLRSIDGRTVVESLVVGGPAERAGTLEAGDEIVAVAPVPGADWIETEAMKLRDVVRMIRGREGTTVQLQLRRHGLSRLVTASIRRARVQLRERQAHGDLLEMDAAAGPEPLPIAVLRLPGFYASGQPEARSSTSDARALLEDFAAGGAAAVVLDLRGNPGGHLDEAIGVASLFLDRGAIVRIADRAGVKTLSDRDGASVWAGPLVVLTDRRSASASEIVAGALGDHGRALLIGDPSTFGKGTVQTLVPIAAEDAGGRLGPLKITTSSYYLPSGVSPHAVGVSPHLVVPSGIVLPAEDLPRRYEARPLGEISPVSDLQGTGPTRELLQDLAAKSQARRRPDAWFQEVDTLVRRALEAAQRKWIPLERRRFAALGRVHPPAERGEAGPRSGAKMRIERDAYMEEVLRITADYVLRIGGTG